MNAAIKQIADVMRRANCAGALQYVPELSWILFLRILDEREEIEAEEIGRDPATLGLSVHIRAEPLAAAGSARVDQLAACRGAGVRRGPEGHPAIPGMLRGYVFDRRSGQRHGLPAAIPIHPAP